ncbi:MAG TPA: efflux RND transporter periplasmic adaptor subunit [Candidatus Ozemobacteraceae bacterium]|nr:efflux RND transporter periplasmic adaptor subunit [Candidatus Ozemobacteraceae bacterium]
MTEVNTTKKQTLTGRLIGPAIGVGGLLFLMLFQGGFFASGQIVPGISNEAQAGNVDTLTVEQTVHPDFYQAIGTVRSRNEIDVVPRIIARILEIKVRSGDVVKRGDVLAVLDAKDLSAVVSQGQEQLRAVTASVGAADEQVKAAKAALDLATKEMERTRALFEKNALAKRDYDQSIAAFRQAEAGMQQAIQQRAAASAQAAAAGQGIKQAEVGLGYATVISPIDAIVAERLADPGDLGNPANVMLRLFDPASLLLEVPVRESLVQEVAIGSQVSYSVPSLGKTFEGTVREIVPSVDPRTRTFLIKVCIDKSEGLMPGMFGTIRVPLKSEKKVIIVPESAIIKTGQLESVVEVEGGRLLRRQIRSIDAGDGKREVISGLKPGQKILKVGNSRS